jgi:replicative DNA helicase
LQVLEDELTNTDNLPQGISEELRSLFKDFLIPLSSNDHDFVRDQLISSVQNKRTDQLIIDFSEQKLTLDQLTAKLGQVTLLNKRAEQQNIKGFLIQDRQHHVDDYVEGAPTFLHDLNLMTSCGGFYTPQLIIFMSGPKHFKTGLIIKLAIEYVRDGYNVYYADNENGLRSIRNRAKQAIMECSWAELYDPTMVDELDITLDNFHRYMQGDIFIDFYPPGTATITDVKNRLQTIYDQHNWKPDIIIWDSIDHFLPTNPSDQKRELRFNIQKVYHEVVALNNELNCFSIAPSQVNRAAVSKKTFNMQDVSEDFSKIMNAHAVFAICATTEELELKIRRIVPVVQREGQKYTGSNQCIVMVDEERMIVNEVDKKEYLKNITDD